jgi:hypothetical protein
MLTDLLFEFALNYNLTVNILAFIFESQLERRGERTFFSGGQGAVQIILKDENRKF